MLYCSSNLRIEIQKCGMVCGKRMYKFGLDEDKTWNEAKSHRRRRTVYDFFEVAGDHFEGDKLEFGI